MKLDGKDRKLLDELQHNARITNAELSQKVGLSISGVQKRLKKLEENEYVGKYAAILDRKKLGYDLLCFVEVSLKAHERKDVADFDESVMRMKEIQECHRLTGGADYLLKVIVQDREHLDSFLLDTLMLLSGVDRVRTRVVLKEIKETTSISTDDPAVS